MPATNRMTSLGTLAVLTLAACGDSTDPMPDNTPLALTAVSAGYYTSCGVGPTGVAYCWGEGREGQLGTETHEDCSEIPGESPCASSPVALTGVFTAVQAGGAHACAIRGDLRVVCWGDGSRGQLGTTSPETDCSLTSSACARTPVPAALYQVVAMLSVGSSHNCVLSSAGMAACWGYNQGGRLGTGDMTNRAIPAWLDTDLRFTTIAAGGTHTCAIATDGRAYCWGYNHLGQLGDSSTTTRLHPTPVATEHRFVQLALGVAHSCGLTESGEAYCWGADGEGQLGTANAVPACDGTYACSVVPVPVAGGHRFTALSAGAFTCGVTADGSFCWGERPDGGASPVPARMGTKGSTGEPFTQISVGFDHACGVTAANTAYCWGSDYHGKLGDGNTRGGPGPVMVRDVGAGS